MSLSMNNSESCELSNSMSKCIPKWDNMVTFLVFATGPHIYVICHMPYMYVICHGCPHSILAKNERACVIKSTCVTHLNTCAFSIERGAGRGSCFPCQRSQAWSDARNRSACDRQTSGLSIRRRSRTTGCALVPPLRFHTV